MEIQIYDILVGQILRSNFSSGGASSIRKSISGIFRPRISAFIPFVFL